MWGELTWYLWSELWWHSCG